MLRTFFNLRAADWDKTIAEKNSSKLEKMAGLLDINYGDIVLDVGTGTGVMVPYLLNRIGTDGRLVALDIAEEMLKICKAKVFSREVDLLHGDVNSLPLSEKVVDVVICYSSFPHFYDKQKSLAEIYRVLKIGGHINICHTSSRNSINSIHKAIPVLERDLIPIADEMIGMLAKAGFVRIIIEDKIDGYLVRAQKIY